MEKFIHGMDISSMDEVVGLGGKYYDKGEERELTDILKSYGVNYIRLRLWLNPYTQEGASYGAGANDLNTTLRMIKRVKAAGFKYLLDFHYSDFWTDPGKQIKPKAWKDYGPAELEVALYEYTKETLLGLKEEGCLPDMVQVGNEITNGILWPEGQVSEFEQLTRFISAGIRGVRKVSRDIPVMLHLDQGNKHKLYQEWFDNYKELGGEEFDIIGLSYYPVWNGRIKGLIENMNALADRYGKRMIVVEVSQPFTMEDYGLYEGLLPEQRKGSAVKPEKAGKLEYPATKKGQQDFMEQFLQELSNIKDGLGAGYFYWEPAWIPVKGSGWATPESLAYMQDKGPCGNEWANQGLFDYEGNALPAWETIKKYSLRF
ncbi:MAG: glycosyl hydrolase [Lachnospiraceae bacterium]|jgi:arabinogalactan endo-1,4-beta-galactosidase|nr:glycosyl hydrolase [Lachnospiraceae bacterium]